MKTDAYADGSYKRSWLYRLALITLEAAREGLPKGVVDYGLAYYHPDAASFGFDIGPACSEEEFPTSICAIFRPYCPGGSYGMYFKVRHIVGKATTSEHRATMHSLSEVMTSAVQDALGQRIVKPPYPIEILPVEVLRTEDLWEVKEALNKLKALHCKKSPKPS